MYIYVYIYVYICIYMYIYTGKYVCIYKKYQWDHNVYSACGLFSRTPLLPPFYPMWWAHKKKSALMKTKICLINVNHSSHPLPYCSRMFWVFRKKNVHSWKKNPFIQYMPFPWPIVANVLCYPVLLSHSHMNWRAFMCTLTRDMSHSDPTCLIYETKCAILFCVHTKKNLEYTSCHASGYTWLRQVKDKWNMSWVRLYMNAPIHIWMRHVGYGWDVSFISFIYDLAHSYQVIHIIDLSYIMTCLIHVWFGAFMSGYPDW